jgi:hypothetical protein
MEEQIMHEAMKVIAKLLQNEPDNQGLLAAQDMIHDIIQGYLI